MDLIDRLRELSTRMTKIVDQLQTEEATKHALVMPFIVRWATTCSTPPKSSRNSQRMLAQRREKRSTTSSCEKANLSFSSRQRRQAVT